MNICIQVNNDEDPNNNWSSAIWEGIDPLIAFPALMQFRRALGIPDDLNYNGPPIGFKDGDRVMVFAENLFGRVGTVDKIYAGRLGIVFDDSPYHGVYCGIDPKDVKKIK